MTRRLLACAVTALVACAPAPAADFVPLSGKPAKGTLTKVDASFVTYKDESGAEGKFGVKELSAVELGGKAAVPAGAFDEVELTDGTLFRVTELKIKGKAVSLKLVPGAGGAAQTIEVPLTAVYYWVRGASEGNVRAEWKKLLSDRGKRDLFVIRQKQAGAPDILQPSAGTVLEGSADGDKISFEGADGAKAEYALTRATGGLVFAQPPQANLPPVACKVLDASGSVLYAQAVETAGSGLTVKTVAGATVEYKELAAVVKLDFGQANVTYLSDLDPKVDAPPPAADEANFAVLKDRTPDDVIRLDGKTYPKGVWIAADVTATYKLGGEYREFKAVAGIVDSGSVVTGDVTVTVEADGTKLLTQTFTRKDKAKELNLSVKDVKELKIAVSTGTLFTRSQLNLGDARVQK